MSNIFFPFDDGSSKSYMLNSLPIVQHNNVG